MPGIARAEAGKIDKNSQKNDRNMKTGRQESQKTEVPVFFCRAKKEIFPLCLTKIFCENGYNQTHSECLGGVAGMVLYLDLFFFLNLMMDLIVLLLCEQIGVWSGISTCGWNFKRAARIIAAAGFGAGFACVAVGTGGSPTRTEQLITVIFVSAGMVLTAFGYQGFACFLCRILSLLAAAMMTAGAVMLVSGGDVSDHMAAGTVIAVGGVLVLFGMMIGRLVSHRVGDSRLFYEVTLKYRGKEKTVRALLDTGNRLREPYGSQPVHVMDARACRGFCEQISAVIYIPFSSVGQSRGLIPGIRMDEMEVRRQGQLIVRVLHPWVALSREPLSPRGEYEMLLNGECGGRRMLRLTKNISG